MEEINQQEFIFKFKQEAVEHIKELNQGLLKLEADPSHKEILDELFRHAHTIKGAARMVGLTKIAELAHKIEDIFGKVREEGRKLSSNEIDLLFSSFDTLDQLLAEEVGRKEETDVKEFCVLLQEDTKGEEEKKKSFLELGSDEPSKPPQVRSFSSGRPREEAVGRRLEDREETIRVKIAKLDKLSDLVSELIMSERQLEQSLWELKEIYVQTKESIRLGALIKEKMQNVQGEKGEKEQLLESLENIQYIHNYLRNSMLKLFKKSLDSFSHLAMKTKDMQQEVLEARMLPLSVILDDLPRAIRDLAKQFKKEISVRIVGGGTELDKKMLEKLRDPLIHLVRNAVDHGIELPEERERLGKDRSGMIEVSSWSEGDRIVVEIKDDGRGINWKKVRKIAVEKGYISPEVENELSEGEAENLLFLPGFSTSAVATDISGRGVGLDIVKRNLEELKGTVRISTTLGQGTTVRLQMPLTLALQRVLLVEVAMEILALPTTSVEEIVNVNWEAVRTIEEKQALLIRDRVIPLAHLGTILGFKGISANGSSIAVVVQWFGQKIAFLVDKVIGEQEIVIKNLGRHLKRVRNVAGATILGSGEVVVILDIADLIKSARSFPAKLPPLKKKKIPTKRSSVLIVEDSLTTREMEKSILEASGYEVDVAVDGIEAIKKAGRRRYDLFLIDVQIPHIDGFQLTEHLRKGQVYKDVPIVIVTSREKEEDRIRGFEIGADAYITKRDFDPKILLNTIDRLIGEKQFEKEKVKIGKKDKNLSG